MPVAVLATMSRILVAVASSHGHTRTIGEAIAQRLREHGHDVELVDVGLDTPGPAGYDAVVLGSRVQLDRHAPAMRDYVRRHRAALEARPTFFFSVSLSAAQPHAGPDPHDYMAKFFAECRWKPSARAAFGGALSYRRYGWVTRFVMQQMSRVLGRSTDTSRDHVYTVWPMVTRFADTIAMDLAPHRLRAARA